MILLVDDDVCYLRVIPHMLKMQNVEVAAINKPAKAQEWFSNTENCQAIILDLHMRDGEGLKLLEWFETQGANIPIIILDNPHRHNYKDFTYSHDYQKLTVPFNAEDLLKVLPKA